MSCVDIYHLYIFVKCLNLNPPNENVHDDVHSSLSILLFVCLFLFLWSLQGPHCLFLFSRSNLDWVEWFELLFIFLWIHHVELVCHLIIVSEVDPGLEIQRGLIAKLHKCICLYFENTNEIILKLKQTQSFKVTVCSEYTIDYTSALNTRMIVILKSCTKMSPCLTKCLK